jgi:hypothetical protein
MYANDEDENVTHLTGAAGPALPWHQENRGKNWCKYNNMDASNELPLLIHLIFIYI